MKHSLTETMGVRRQCEQAIRHWLDQTEAPAQVAAEVGLATATLRACVGLARDAQEQQVAELQQAAAAIELEKSDCGFTEGPATGLGLGLPLPATFLNPLLGDAGLTQVFGGNGCDLHEVLASE